MVAIKYNGSNYIVVGSYKIVKGINEIKDDDFYRMMKIKSFAYRVENRIFEVPHGFPLVKPDKNKKAADQPVKEEVNQVHESEPESQAPFEGRLSSKATIKAISTSEDINFLNRIIKNDDRKILITAAQDRIKYLNSKVKK